MNTEFCSCNLGLGNTGLPQGVKPFGKLSYIIAVYTRDGEGNLNKINKSDTIDQTYLNARFNDPDPLKRWYPMKDLKLVDRPKEDSVERDLGDGTSEIVREGGRSFASEIPSGTATYLSKITGGKCVDLSFYEVDICQQLGGNGRSKDFLYPYKMAKQSLDAFLLLADDTRLQGISLNFQYDANEKDQLRTFITDRSITGSLFPDDVRGIIDVNVESEDAKTTTRLDVTLSYDYGDHFDPKPYKVAEQTDFTLFNVDTDSAVPLIGFSIIDASEGKYQLQFAAQAPGNDAQLSISPANKAGFEMKVYEFEFV